MESQVICPNCNEDYRDDNLPRLLVACGHTFCEECLESFVVSKEQEKFVKCPEDEICTDITNRSLKNLPKNQALIKLMNSKNNTLPPFKVSSCDVSKITKKDDGNNQDEDDADLMSFINLGNDSSKNNISGSEKKSEESEKGRKHIQECYLHKKPLDVVCTIDMIKICANCAIFGDHRGHTFKSIEQVQKMRLNYYNSLLEIFDKKQELSAEIQSQKNRQELITMVTDRKKNMKKQINDFFVKITEKLEEKKQETIKKLNVAANRAQSKIKQLMKFDKQTLNQYATWQEKSYQQIKLLENTNEQHFVRKMNLLFQEVQGEGKSLREGDDILQNMREKIDGLFQGVQSIISLIGINTDDQIFAAIDNVISIKTEEKTTKKSDNDTSILAASAIKKPVMRQSQVGLKKIPMKQKSIIIKTEKPVVPVVNVIQPKGQQQNDDDFLLQEQNPQPKSEQKCNQSIIIDEPAVGRFSLHPKMTINFDKIDESFDRLEKQNKNKRINLGASSINKSLNTSMVRAQKAKPDKLYKKKLSQLKIPPKFEKVVEGLITDSLELIDLTNAELGDATIAQISEILPSTRVRNAKLIRNKLTDEGVSKFLPNLANIVTLNLSQNMLTENVLDLLADSKEQLPCLKNIILSQNKINQRKSRPKIEKLKKMDWTISL